MGVFISEWHLGFRLYSGVGKWGTVICIKKKKCYLRYFYSFLFIFGIGTVKFLSLYSLRNTRSFTYYNPFFKFECNIAVCFIVGETHPYYPYSSLLTIIPNISAQQDGNLPLMTNSHDHCLQKDFLYCWGLLSLPLDWRWMKTSPTYTERTHSTQN